MKTCKPFIRLAAPMLVLAATAADAAAQGGTRSPAPPAAEARAARTVGAVRAETRPRVDGQLDEAIWSSADPATGFVQREPREGEPAQNQTEVRFAVDDDALYIGAYMKVRDPEALRRIVARRDRETPSDQLLISLDTYRDRLTAYTFGVNVAGVRVDYYHPMDAEGRQERTYDPVWEAATAIVADGWTAEIRIPLSQLRFNEEVETWGVNAVRMVPSDNERSYWSLVGRREAGWSSRMGVLTGVEGLEPARRVEVLPYVATDTRLRSQVDGRNPFVSERESAFRTGADVKVGLGSSLTLEATINPDFGQVEADPAEVNLTAFETFFPERRPFFIEGSSYLGGRGAFYSRRIGAPPLSARGVTYAEELDNTTILGAAKLTGRLPSKLSIGAVGAVTAEETVATLDTVRGVRGTSVVAPLTSYGVATVQQEFGRLANVVSATVTAVNRDLEPGSFLAAVLPERAVAGVLDTRIRWGGGRYDISSWLIASHVEGDTLAMRLQQLSPRRYFQRPDVPESRLRTRTSLSGTQFGIGHSKLAGTWLWDIDYVQVSPGLELNDAGASGAVDNRAALAALQYRHTTPGKYLRSYAFGVRGMTSWNFDGDRTGRNVMGISQVMLRNFWTAGVQLGYSNAELSDRLTRGGPLMATAQGWMTQAQVTNSASSRNRWRTSVGYQNDELGGWLLDIGGGIAVRHGARLEASIDPRYVRGVVSRQHVLNRGGGRQATFGQRNIFAYVDREELVARVRVNYAITPDLTLESYIEPFASSGNFRDFGELAAARTNALRTYGTDGTTIRFDNGSWLVTDGTQSFRIPNRNFDVLSFRSNAVLRWEWRPGSTMYVVWQQNRAGVLDEPGAVGPGALLDAVSARGENMFAVKVSYWLPF